MSAKILTIFFALSGILDADKNRSILIEDAGRSFYLGKIFTREDGNGLQVSIRAKNGKEFCRDVVFDISFDKSNNPTIESSTQRSAYGFFGSKGSRCGDKNTGGYGVEFELDRENNLSDVDVAISAILQLSSSKNTQNDIIIFDENGILNSFFEGGKWKFLEIYNDFGKKMDKNGSEMKPRAPSVVFHLGSIANNDDVYVVAFFPRDSKKITLFVLKSTALPL
jgi:hypothetical protein